jgi:beta-glucosidase
MLAKRFSLILLTILVLSACTFSTNKKGEQAIAKKVATILDQMTLAEKVGQMTQVDKRLLDSPEDIQTYHIGSILSGGGSVPKINTPRGWLEMVNGYQKIAMNNRLGIPLIYGIDAVHGHNNVLGATVFPHNLALGAANDADLVYRVNKATAIEVASTGIHWTFSPCITIPQDPRWGRFYEGFGQTTAIVDALTNAAVLGYQDRLSSVQNKQVAACAKHFIGDGATVWGTGTRVDGVHTYMLDRGDVQLDDKTLREIYLPPYKTAIAADVKTIMASFNSIRGEKCHGSKYILTDLLKEELGFEGFVVSDWAGIDEIPGDYKQDVINGVNAGIDMVMVPGIMEGQNQEHYKTFIKFLIEAVNEGSVSIKRIDDAVRRILKVKMELGLFEDPYIDDSHLDKIGSLEHRALAREAVQKSAVLLKNNGVLPFDKSTSITIVGSAAHNLGVQNGGWTTDWQGIFTPDFTFLDYNNDGTLTKKEYVSQIEKVYENKFEEKSWVGHFEEIDQDNNGKVNAVDFTGFMSNRVLQPNGTTILDGIKEVAPNAKVTYDPNANTIPEGDVVLAVIGEYPYAEGFGDDADLRLNKADLEILERVYASGNKVVVVLISGRPLMISEYIQNWDAFVASFLPGMAGEGLADVLFGDTNPQGKLSFTWPTSVNGIDVLYVQGSGEQYN